MDQPNSGQPAGAQQTPGRADDLPPRATEQLFDGRRFRDVLGQYPTGVAVVSGVDQGEQLALIVGTFSSVSLDPPLVSFMPMRTSKAFARLRECGSLCISVLSVDQEQTVRTLATQWPDKFAGVDTFASPSGDPVLAGAVAWLDTRLEQVVEAGDHYIALCRVQAMDMPNPGAPLIFFQGGYGTFSVPSLVTRMEPDIAPAVRQAEAVRPVLERLAADLGCEAALMYRTGEELVAVASAVGPGLRVTCELGQRVPVIPPVADIFVAFAGQAAQQEWLDRCQDCDPAQLAVYRERLAFARSHGYLMSFLPPGDESYTGLTGALGHRGAGGTMTASQEQDLHAAWAWSDPIYRPRELHGDEEHRLASLVVPVRGADGEVHHSIRLSQLGADDGHRARAWVSRLQRAAREASELLAEQ